MIESKRESVGKEDMMMSFWWLLLILLLVQQGGTRAAQSSGEVHEVSAANFDDFVSSSSVVLLEFYAPWCRLCIQFEDSYRTIGASLSASNVKVGKLNSAVNEAFSARFATQSVPTLFVIKGNTVYRYTGALSHDSVVQYAKDGHNNDDSLPLWSSPMGPFGKIKGLMITTGLKIYSMPSELSEKYGLSPTGSTVLAVIIVAFTLLVLLFSVVYLTL